MIALWHRTHPAVQRFARFVVVGLLNTGVGYALYAFFLEVVHLRPYWALTVSFWLGVVWNYLSTARFVFGKSGFRRLPGYVLCYLAVYALNARALAFAIRHGIGPLLAQALLIPVTAVLTFVLVGLVLTAGSGKPAPIGRAPRPG